MIVAPISVLLADLQSNGRLPPFVLGGQPAPVWLGTSAPDMSTG